MSSKWTGPTRPGQQQRAPQLVRAARVTLEPTTLIYSLLSMVVFYPKFFSNTGYNLFPYQRGAILPYLALYFKGPTHNEAPFSPTPLTYVYIFRYPYNILERFR